MRTYSPKAISFRVALSRGGFWHGATERRHPPRSDFSTGSWSLAPEHSFDGAAVRGGERHVGQFGEEEPLLISLEAARGGDIENGQRHAMVREGISEEGQRFGDGRWAGQRGEFPQAAPACAGLLFEEDAASAHDPRAVFTHGDGLGAGFFNGEKFGVFGAAWLADGAEQALRFVWRAEERA